MSSLWTPGGEHEVPRPGSGDAAATAPATAPEATVGAAPTDPAEEMSPEEKEQAEAMMAEMAEVRRQLAEVPAAVVVANHAMGLYELAAVHLSQQPPNFDESEVAIDALGALLESVKGRLGAEEHTLTDALDQLRMAFVSLRSQAGGAPPDAPPDPQTM